MQTYGNPNVTYGWWVGNAGVTNKTNRFISSHVGHTGLIAFTAGANTLWELGRYDPSVPMGSQGLVSIPHLASMGLGFDEAGVWTGVGVATIGIFHCIFSLVYGGASLLHALAFSEDTQDSSGLFGPNRPEHRQAKRFRLDWSDPDRLTFILGHHLLFLALGNVMFVEWARYHGIYDPAIGAVRTVFPGYGDFGMIWSHQFDFLTIDNLEDVMSGHAFLAFFMSTGAVFHIFTRQIGEYTTAKGAGLLSAEAVLSWSLAGIGWMGIMAAFWCAQNTTVYPSEFYGDPVSLQFGIAPYWVDTVDPESSALFGHSSRAYLVNFHYMIGFFNIQGHLWHALRSMGFNFRRIPQALTGLSTSGAQS